MFIGCISSSRIVVQDDIVNSSKRLELRYLIRDFNKRSPLLYLVQQLVKEIKSDTMLAQVC